MSKILKVALVDPDYDPSYESPYYSLCGIFGPRLYTRDCPNLVYKVHADMECDEISEESAVAALETLAVYFIDKKLSSGILDIAQRELDLASQKETKELSLKELEDMLGYPIKIVNKED